MFFDKLCNISQHTASYTSWEYTETVVVIYSSIACDFYKSISQGQIYQDNFTVEATDNNYTLVLEWDKTNVKRGYVVEIIDSTIWVYWKYIIDDILPYRDMNWNIDNIEIKLSEKKK